MYNSGFWGFFFGIFTKLCDHHSCLILEHFHDLRKRPYAHQQSLPISLFP